MNDESNLTFCFGKTSNFHIKISDLNHLGNCKQVWTEATDHTKIQKSQIFAKFETNQHLGQE